MLPTDYAPPRKVERDERLTDLVLDYLDSRPPHYTFKFIAQHTGITAFRIQSMANRRYRDIPTSDCLALYEFFTGRKVTY